VEKMLQVTVITSPDTLLSNYFAEIRCLFRRMKQNQTDSQLQIVTFDPPSLNCCVHWTPPVATDAKSTSSSSPHPSPTHLVTSVDFDRVLELVCSFLFVCCFVFGLHCVIDTAPARSFPMIALITHHAQVFIPISDQLGCVGSRLIVQNHSTIHWATSNSCFHSLFSHSTLVCRK
jgi:hypothetical protein